MEALDMRLTALALASLLAVACEGAPGADEEPLLFSVEVANASGITAGDPLYVGATEIAGGLATIRPISTGVRITVETMPGGLNPNLRTGDRIEVVRGSQPGRGSLRLIRGDSTLPLLPAGGILQEFPRDSAVARHMDWQRTHAELQRSFDSVAQPETLRRAP